MAEVTIVIKGRQYDIACDDGQEDRVIKLASYIDNKIKLIARSGSAYNESHLMVLTSLVLADEIFEAQDALEDAKKESKTPKASEKSSSKADSDNVIEMPDDAEAVKMIESVTGRLNSLVSKIREAS